MKPFECKPKNELVVNLWNVVSWYISRLVDCDSRGTKIHSISSRYTKYVIKLPVKDIALGACVFIDWLDVW